MVKIEVTFDRGLANGELRVYRVVPDQGKTFVAKFTYTEGLRGPKPGHWVVVPD